MMMFNKIKSKIKRDIYNNKLQSQISDALIHLNKPHSAIFYTTHKCASTFVYQLFDVILKNSEYEFVDYAGAIFGAGDKLSIESPYETFLEQAYSELYSLHGRVYGPQRQYLDFPGRNNFKHIFFLRDPRDVLVSSFFSRGFTHAEPLNTIHQSEFIKKRVNAKEKGIDNYVLEEAKAWIYPLYKQYNGLRKTAKNSIYLKYDLFVEDTPKFIQKISAFLDLHSSREDINFLTKEASPVQDVEIMKHKRSGKTGQYLEKLHPSTVEKLNQSLSNILADWEFKY